MQDVPSGTLVRSSDKGVAELVFPNGSLQILPQCAEVIPESSQRPGRWRSVAAGDLNDDHKRPVTWWGDRLQEPLDSFTTEYYVPDRPETGPGLSWWIGVENSETNVVIQPVVWTAGSSWHVVSEICCPGGQDLRVGDRQIHSRDLIYGSISRDYGTHYTITIRDDSGEEWTLHHDMGQDMVMPLIEAEMYEPSYHCSDMPEGPLQAQQLRSSPRIRWQDATGSLMDKCGWNAWIGNTASAGLTASANPPDWSAPKGADAGLVAAAQPPGLSPPKAIVI